ncbi:MAG TPA: pyridoxamine 5'-phosphate oxidase [Gemmatales bacterium]|nr:pyridoxamine 5'-phosphate oxidase [Gemmatales bacterium]
MAADLSHFRLEYCRSGLAESELHANPIEQFKHWLSEALKEKLPEPYAMTLATVSADGQPSARIVLLRHVTATGFQFFTNYHSRKGMEIAGNQKGALLFYWAEMERQVRVEGTISRTTDEVSDRYFSQRPRLSQLSARASEQSEIVADRATLEQAMQRLEQELEGKPVPRPEHWGGYELIPNSLEFWQGRPSRLHDRLRYRRASGQWIIERLCP